MQKNMTKIIRQISPPFAWRNTLIFKPIWTLRTKYMQNECRIYQNSINKFRHSTTKKESPRSDKFWPDSSERTLSYICVALYFCLVWGSPDHRLSYSLSILYVHSTKNIPLLEQKNNFIFIIILCIFWLLIHIIY